MNATGVGGEDAELTTEALYGCLLDKLEPVFAEYETQLFQVPTQAVMLIIDFLFSVADAETTIDAETRRTDLSGAQLDLDMAICYCRYKLAGGYVERSETLLGQCGVSLRDRLVPKCDFVTTVLDAKANAVVLGLKALNLNRRVLYGYRAQVKCDSLGECDRLSADPIDGTLCAAHPEVRAAVASYYDAARAYYLKFVDEDSAAAFVRYVADRAALPQVLRNLAEKSGIAIDLIRILERVLGG